jgi:signal transduction histidine kinase
MPQQQRKTRPGNGRGGPAEDAAAAPGMTPRQQRWVEAGLIFGFWIALFAVSVSQHVRMHEHGLWREGGQWVLPYAVRYLTWALLSVAVFWMIRHFPLRRRNWTRRLPLFLGVGVVMAFIGNTTARMSRFYWGTCDCDDTLLGLLGDQLRTGFHLQDFLVYLAVFGAGLALNYYRKYQERQQQAARLEKQLAEARLEALRMQIHPHFLFNTLHTISSFVDYDPPAARRMVARLSDLLRRALERADRSEVPLREELLFADDYLAIMQIRMEGRLSVEKDIAPGAEDALVPNLVLQPLVENAVKHGVSENAGPGCVRIEAWREGEQLHLRVADDGPGLPTSGEPLAEGIGLENTRDRLRERYGEAGRLLLHPARGSMNGSANGRPHAPSGSGLAATLSLPYHTAGDLRLEAVT